MRTHVCATRPVRTHAGARVIAWPYAPAGGRRNRPPGTNDDASLGSESDARQKGAPTTRHQGVAPAHDRGGTLRDASPRSHMAHPCEDEQRRPHDPGALAFRRLRKRPGRAHRAAPRRLEARWRNHSFPPCKRLCVPRNSRKGSTPSPTSIPNSRACANLLNYHHPAVPPRPLRSPMAVGGLTCPERQSREAPSDLADRRTRQTRNAEASLTCHRSRSPLPAILEQ